MATVVDIGGSQRGRRVGGGDKAGAEARAARSKFWNLALEFPMTRIQAFVEHRVGNSNWFFRCAEKGGVTKEVICGSGDRVP